jgi:hypothetical protein
MDENSPANAALVLPVKMGEGQQSLPRLYQSGDGFHEYELSMEYKIGKHSIGG